MTLLALELHDGGLFTVDEAGTISAASPGFALYDGGAVVTGEAAMRRAREKPRWIHNRYWQELDTEPLGRPFPRDLVLADLAHAQLSTIWDTAKHNVDRVLLTVPGCFTPRQLGLLLGIARSCDMPICGMVDTAVAATVAAAATPIFQRVAARTRTLLHLDLHLHRAVLTKLELTVSPISADPLDARVVRRRVVVDPSVGQLNLHDTWVRRIAELFVHATRFDPLHAAATEQQLYDRLPEWLTALNNGEVLEVQAGPATAPRVVELTRPDIVDAADATYDQLRDLVLAHKPAGEPVTVLLAQRIAELPGLEPRLAGLRDVTIVPLPTANAASGALRAQAEILETGTHNAESNADPAGLPFVTRSRFEIPLATYDPQQDDPPRQASLQHDAPYQIEPTALSRPPSHLLVNGLAYPITEQPFALGSTVDQRPGLQLDAAGLSPWHCSLRQHNHQVEVEDHSSGSSWLNGQQITERTPLKIGDRLHLGDPGLEVQLIALAEPGQATLDDDSDGTA